MAASARQSPVPPRLSNDRGDHRQLLRGLELAARRNRPHPLPVLLSVAPTGQQLIRSVLVETTSSKTEKVPPKPQHSSGRAGAANSIPSTFDSRSIGFEKNGWCSSEGAACFNRRSVPQLLCNPTRCGNRAQGNDSTF